MPLCGKSSPRLRLPAEARRARLLDAALAEFSSHGFTAATIESIAARAGLSKSGFYAHFRSKESIFQSLLDTLLMPQLRDPWGAVEQGVPLLVVIDSFIADSYRQLVNPVVMALFRVMVADGPRVAHLTRRWERETLLPYIDAQQQTITRMVNAGLIRRSPLTDHFVLTVAPVVYTAVRALVLEGLTPQDVADLQEAHRQLLRDMLSP